jgi:hypothetical protein
MAYASHTFILRSILLKKMSFCNYNYSTNLLTSEGHDGTGGAARV